MAHVIIAQTTTLPDASVDLSSQLRIPCLGRHLLPDSLAAESGVSAPVSERDVALWVLREGGRVLLDGAAEYTSDRFALPAGTVHLVGVDMHGTVADPKELEPLRHLTGLRELFLSARVWSPASDIKAPYSAEVFDFFSGMKHLERFQAGLTTLAWRIPIRF